MPPEVLPLAWLFDWVFDLLGGWLVAWWLLLGWLLAWPSAERVVALGAIGQLVVLVAAVAAAWGSRQPGKCGTEACLLVGPAWQQQSRRHQGGELSRRQTVAKRTPDKRCNLVRHVVVRFDVPTRAS